jgi:hypothetical protein
MKRNMKTIFNKFLVLSGLGLLMLSACKKDGALVVSNGGKAGSLTASTTTPALDRTKLTDTTSVVRFNFTQPTFNFSAAVTNTLQIDAPGDNWKNPILVPLGYKVYSQGFSVINFNNMLLKLNLPADVASQVQVRIAHSLSTATTPVYSNVLTVTATPFNLTSWLYIVGQFNGYSTATPDSLISATGNGVYTGIINFPTGQNRFLILPAKNYNNKYATTASPNTGTASLSYATEYVSGGGSDLYAPSAAGQYIVTLDTKANTVSVTPANSYSIIGDAAQGWGTDVAMKFVNDGNNNWVSTLSLVSTGQFKVRQNNDWTYSWGVPKAGSAGAGVAGALNDSTNDNITVAATGMHTVTFNIPITTAGTVPSVLASYTLK